MAPTGGFSMRTLLVLLVLVAVAGWGCAPRDPKADFGAAQAAFLDAVHASAVEGKPIPDFASEVGGATRILIDDVKEIPYPDDTLADAEALVEAAAELDERCRRPRSRPRSPGHGVAGDDRGVRKVRTAGAVVATELGIAPADSPDRRASSIPIAGDPCGELSGGRASRRSAT
jgi:hypothetical protein